MDAQTLRRAFTAFFADREHTTVPSAGLIPHHPTAPLFTNAGMNQFVPYFLGEEPSPYARATSIQKCIRTIDIDIIGDQSHLSFFEMLGNFSFGDYFKERAIPLAWELVTTVFGIDPDQLWITVHDSDDDAEAIWIDTVGVEPERVQRMGEDNFWEMQKGGAGPCGPCSEIYVDLGPDRGEGGGPAKGSEARYLEIWNLVFMQYERQADGTLVDLPRMNIDTGAGMERILPVLQGKDDIYDTDVLRPIVAAAERLTGTTYGADNKTDVSLRIMSDHARATTFLVNDGVFPSNEERGYVARRLIRRIVRHAHQLGSTGAVANEMVASVVDTLGDAWPDLVANAEFISGVIGREEDRFRQTLKAGTALLEAELDSGAVTGDVAFKLHDTFGFPIELTQEIAAERGIEVDLDGFAAAMGAQRRRAKEARKTGGATDVGVDAYRELLERVGPTEFTGYTAYQSTGRVLAVLDAGEGRVEVFLDRTPFYAEGGGQIGDSGTLTTGVGVVEVRDTTYALPGLHRHLGIVTEGEVREGEEATAAVDGRRRDAIRRNHTGTHLLHWALREVLGDQVKQQSSYVGPDRLRFDINHHAPLNADELRRVEDLVNERVLANEPVRAFETTMEEARALGAIMFFGDKYGEHVRVVEAGDRSRELCGGTHVGALGFIGPMKIVSEGSIGSNLRRIEAVTGTGTIEVVRDTEEVLDKAAQLLKTKPDEVAVALERLLDRQRQLDDEVKVLRAGARRAVAAVIAAAATDGVVVERRDHVAPDELRELAIAVRDQPGITTVHLIGTPDGERVAIVGAVAKGGESPASLVGEAAKLTGGGGGGKGDVAVAGGRDPTKIDEALALIRIRLGLA
ncbi:MAG TPA: alanine--tRNA ligase [Acidimicrobiales bacterium]|nr:alanine--tRNA ligase [Acidimicrobiales bacterium]